MFDGISPKIPIFRQGRPKVALIYFDKACDEIEFDPPIADPYLARSKCHIQLGEVILQQFKSQ